MGKAMGAMAFIFAVGVGASTALGSVFGSYAEAAAVTFMGLGLLASGQLLGTKFSHAGSGEPVET